MLCSITVIVWNRPEYTQRTIDSLLANTDYPHEITVIDNASDNIDYLLSIRKHVRLILNNTNIGKANANNLGWLQSRGQFVCTVENDIVFTDRLWLTKCVNALSRVPELGIVSPTNHLRQICQSNNAEWKPNLITRNGVQLDLITDKPHPFAFNGEYRFSDGTTSAVYATEHMIPGTIVTRRDVINRVGYHAVKPVAYYSSASDYTIRVRQHGLLTAYLPDVQCEHLGMDEMFRHMMGNYVGTYMQAFKAAQRKQIDNYEFVGMK